MALASRKLPPFDLDARLRDDMSVEEARLEAEGIALRLALVPEGDSGIRASVDGRVHGGTLSAALHADWARQWRISGKAKVAGVDLVPLQVLLGKSPKFSGNLHADATFQSRARKPDLLAGALSLDSPVQVVGGVYHGYDLSKVGGLSGKLAPGGATHIDELTGKLELRGKRIKIRELCARSPDLVVGGNVEIGAEQQLSGKLDVSVAKTGGFVGIPVALKGTTTDPSFTPTTGFLIGAAVGTVILPFIGTSIGSSIGSRIEGSSGCK